MTRGRKKDLTIPPSRTISQQREYRARRANYVADLEQRCRRAEAENKQLRRELLAARAGVPALTNPQIAEVSSELIHNLSLASASITRFQNIIFSESPGASLSGSDQPAEEVLGHLRAATFPSTSSTHPYSQTVSTTPVGESFPEDSHALTRSRQRSPPSVLQSYRHHSPSSGSECCGGIFDCHDLIEKDATHDVQQYSPIGRFETTKNIAKHKSSVPQKGKPLPLLDLKP